MWSYPKDAINERISSRQKCALKGPEHLDSLLEGPAEGGQTCVALAGRRTSRLVAGLGACLMA